eukprot:scaffold20688_cov65-Phaeocystis_antarctica.AAC.4
MTTSGQHSCQSEGASSTRVWRRMTSISSCGSSSVTRVDNLARQLGSVHWVATAAKARCGMRRARVSSMAKPFSGHGLTIVTKRCCGSHGRMAAGSASSPPPPPPPLCR